MHTFRISRQALVGAALLLAGITAHAGEITVSAAASLTNAFKEIGSAYQKQYPDAKVRFNFAASGPLLQQIAKGAPVDVFASADQTTMDQAQKRGLINEDSRRNFVQNSLVLVVPADNKLPIQKPEDLARPEVTKFALGNPSSVPVGRYSVQALSKLKQWPTIQPKAIHTQNVRQSLDYVARGEVNAGFVYATDAAIMPDKVKVVSVVPTSTPVSYPIATVKASTQQAEARRFVTYILSPAGQAVLTKYGFKKAW